ncbi:MAG: hypothetical protein FD135_1980 [Comamonadaceae bacterium]|nr:MAG: hypothetical protein FD135_1980 [Comamonadaceae bacterium]
MATLLGRLEAFLPAGQTLQVKGVQGSLHHGGQIAWLRWSQPGLSVEARDIQIAWTLPPLLNKHLRLSDLSMATLSIDDQRPGNAATPPSAPTDLRLPIRVDIPFKVTQLSLKAGTALEATEISGNYSFDSALHKLSKLQGHISSGKYQLNGELQASSPMALKLEATGQVQTTLPSSPKRVTIAASAQLTGQLGGPQALLMLQGSLTPELDNAPSAAAMQATLSARISPWQAQPLSQAQAQWQALNLAALWPQAPQTQLSGQASVRPAGQGWQGQIQLNNALPGPWNQQRLPLNTLQAELSYQHSQWALSSLLASGAGGRISGTGNFSTGQWQGSASLSGINPAAVDSRLASTALNGTLQAQSAGNSLDFTAQLQASAPLAPSTSAPSRNTRLPAVRLQSLHAQGQWADALLSLNTLRIQAEEAQLSGQLTYHTRTQSAQGKLNLALPGLQGLLEGQLASTSGEGRLSLNLADANQAADWLKRWPGAAHPLQDLRLQGSAQLQAHWQGGWQQLDQALRLDASLHVPQLNWRNTKASTVSDGQIREVNVALSGTLPALTLSTQGQWGMGQRQLHWQAQAQGGQLKPGHWQGALSALQLQAQDSAHPGLWTLASGGTDTPAATLDWQDSGATRSLTIGSSTAQLTGPLPGKARLSWQALRWSQAHALVATPAKSPAPPQETQAQWQSQGQISQLPLAWLDALSGKTMADLGLSSDVMLAGSWEAQQTHSLSLSAMLERSSGDVRLSTDSKRQQPLPALMQEARLNVNLAGDDLSGSLRWDSARAGKALLAFSTQLQTLDSGWRWPQDAPVGASVQMQLPPVDAWSVLAPPGWRMRGTLDAHATLTGTRQQPHWAGIIQAQNLAVRSVADGIDFQQGSLRARLDGQQLHLEDFTLHGAGGASGGQVKITGLAQWRTATQPSTTLAQQLQINLQADLQALRVSNRSDRLVSVSGKLNAALKNNTLQLRGKLTADHAMFILPSESAPKLGDDVVVRPAAVPSDKAALGKPAPKPAQAGTRITPDVQISLDLGPDFQLRGRGLVTRLAGQLELKAMDQNNVSLVGSVRTRRGTYQAYGQRLDIEQGELRFFGPPNIAVLDILALRPQISQRIGVQVLGSTLSPVVRLYADPELPEADKLAWLVLGRSASGRGGEAALLQQAAMALLGGNDGASTGLMQALGLDEIAFQGNSGGTATGTTVTLGKRLSQDIYVAYESGMAGTMGVFTIFYDLSRRLTLRAQTGEQSAVDLIWTQRNAAIYNRPSLAVVQWIERVPPKC